MSKESQKILEDHAIACTGDSIIHCPICTLTMTMTGAKAAGLSIGLFLEVAVPIAEVIWDTQVDLIRVPEPAEGVH